MPTNPNMEDNRLPLPTRFQPGFFTEGAPREAPTRWRTGSLVRFHDGEPQKLGGWVLKTVSGDAARGSPRRIHEWSSLDGEAWIAVGTNSQLFLLNRGTRYNITPLRRTITLANPITAQNASSTVTITDAGHGAETGDTVKFTGASAVGGLSIAGEYTILAVLGNTFTINGGAQATSSATGGGASVKIEYEITAGSKDQTLAIGYGVGTYGVGTWGSERSISASGITLRLRKWSLDNFGEDLIASPRGEGVYHWDRTNGPTTRAVLLPDAPSVNQRVLLSNSGGQIICLGAFDPVSNRPDKMLIRVGAEESLTDFTVALNSTAFDKRLSVGTEIVSGVRCRGGIFVSTDQANYLMQPSASEIFTVDKLSEGDTPISPDAVFEVNGVVYFWSRSKKFMTFDGVLQELPCDVWEYLFTETNLSDSSTLTSHPVSTTQFEKVYGWYNEDFHEAWWLYPAATDSDVSLYVVYNIQDRIWYFGQISRSVMLPQGPSYSLPLGLDYACTTYTHEDGKNAAGQQMGWSLQSHDIELGDGKRVMLVSSVVPDFARLIGSMLLTLQARRRPRDEFYVQKGPYTITETTREKGVKIVGRQVNMTLGPTGNLFSDINDDFRLSRWTFYVQPDGER